MQRVDFIGANGVGKTTALNHALAEVTGPLFNQWQGRLAVAMASLGGLPLKKRLVRQLALKATGRRTRRAKQIRDQRVALLLEQQDETLRHFVELAMAIISSSELSVSEKRNETAWFFDALYDALYLEAGSFDGAALCDESISLKTLMVAMLSSSSQSVDALFEMMPAPALLVAVHGTEQEIYQRLVARERHVARSAIHYLRGRSREEVMGQLARLQGIAVQACKILERRGTRVIRLDVDRNDLEEQTRILRPALTLLLDQHGATV